MSLNWNASKCAEKDFILGEDPNGYRVTQCIIFSLMDVGMRGILGEDDAAEFVRRTAEIAPARGGTMMQQMREGEIVDRPYTLEEAKLRIGLTTNVSPMTRRQFAAKLKKVAEAAQERAAEEWAAEELECEGHESLDGAHMSETVFCDGSCRKHERRAS